MLLTIFLEKNVASVEEAKVLTDAVKKKLEPYSDIKVQSQCTEVIESVE